MGVARFIAVDPFSPEATDAEIDNLLSKMDGVADWTIHADGDVTVKYHLDSINDQQIEDALSGLGFRITPLSGRPKEPELSK